MSYFRDNVVVPKLLRLDGKCIFLLFEHFVEHGKLVMLYLVPNIRGY